MISTHDVTIVENKDREHDADTRHITTELKNKKKQTKKNNQMKKKKKK